MSGGDSHSALIVRESRPEDAAAVRALLDEVYAPYATHFPATVWTTYRREITDVASRQAVADLLVATRRDTVVGTVTFYPSGAVDGHGWPASFASFRLLAVAPDARGSGVGRRLVEECIDRARRLRVDALGLHTAPFMVSAIALYEAMGFSRAPDHDFDAHDVYAGPAGSPGVAGLAYVLALHEASPVFAEEPSDRA